jgi:hypothetical protein
MFPYRHGQKFDSNDDTIIVSQAMSKRIICIMEDMMRVDNIS